MSQVLSQILQQELSAAFPGGNNIPGLYQNKQFTDALAAALQRYLQTSVTVAPGIPTAGSAFAQATVAPGILIPQ